eukprot:COSAG05_NODE_1799_length_4068_cov_5.997480_1_plen_219_part_00
MPRPQHRSSPPPRRAFSPVSVAPASPCGVCRQQPATSSRGPLLALFLALRANPVPDLVAQGSINGRVDVSRESPSSVASVPKNTGDSLGPLERNEDAPDDPTQGRSREDAISDRIDAQLDERDSLHNLGVMKDDVAAVAARELDRDEALKEYQDAVRKNADMELPSNRKKYDPLWYQEDYDSGDDELGDMDFSRENVDTIFRDKYFRNAERDRWKIDM